MKVPNHEWWCKAGDVVQTAAEWLATVLLFAILAPLGLGAGMALVFAVVYAIGGR